MNHNGTTNNTPCYITQAIEQAAEWLRAGETLGGTECQDEHRRILKRFRECLEEEDLLGAISNCAVIARRWHGSVRSGFVLLDALCSALGEILCIPNGSMIDDEPDMDEGRVLRFGRDTSGEWGVVIAWDGGVATVETVQRAAELGAWDEDALMVLGLLA